MTKTGAARGSTATIVLLGLALLISYADRGNLSTVAPVLQTELHISNTTLGWLLSAFFWVYAPAQLLFGSFSQRFGGRYVLAAGLALWSVATLCTGFVTGLVSLIALRLLLGLGEAAFFPCASHLIAEVVPEERRGSANGIIMSGIAIGPIAGTLAAGFLLAALGWRMVFVIFGIASLLWLIPWLTLAKATPATHAHTQMESASYGDVIRERKAWGLGLSHFCVNYVGYLVLTWLPTYLVKDQGFTIPQMAVIGAVVFSAQAIGSISAGVISDALVSRGGDPGRTRKAIMLAGIAAEVTAMIGIGLSSGEIAVVLLVMGGFVHGVISSMLYAIAQTLSGPRAAGRWMGLQNFLANVAGIIVPVVTGIIVDKTGSYYGAFAAAAAVGVAGFLLLHFMVGKVEPVTWKTRPRLVPAE
jgi:MFS family permease